MRIAVVPDNLIERLLLAGGVVPRPLLDTFTTILLARTVMAATKFGVFEALSDAPRTAREVAERCETDQGATESLLNALVGANYLVVKDDQFSLTSMSRKWLLRDSPTSLHDNILFRYLEWDVIGNYEEFIRTGVSIDAHQYFKNAEQWALYQRGMRSLASLSASEIARRVPVPQRSRALLDVGGSHGYYSVALCRRYPGLHATVLDLPEAVEQAAPILARERMGPRVVHLAGDALTDDLGAEAWDVVFTANLLHHFDDATNREFSRRVARALRPGGVFAILEIVRPDSPTDSGQTGALLDLYFSLTSQSGTWTSGEMADWQVSAGLRPMKPIRLRTVPGAEVQAAKKVSKTVLP